MLLASLAHTLIRAERSAEHLHQHLYGLRHGRFFKKSLDLFGDCLSVPGRCLAAWVCVQYLTVSLLRASRAESSVVWHSSSQAVAAF
jgi:hypothetical protein